MHPLQNNGFKLSKRNKERIFVCFKKKGLNEFYWKNLNDEMIVMQWPHQFCFIRSRAHINGTGEERGRKNTNRSGNRAYRRSSTSKETKSDSSDLPIPEKCFANRNNHFHTISSFRKDDSRTPFFTICCCILSSSFITALTRAHVIFGLNDKVSNLPLDCCKKQLWSVLCLQCIVLLCHEYFVLDVFINGSYDCTGDELHFAFSDL
ncbi:hypothetical protein EGR_03863 [Echinococcus granulosus]|uniref:Uncharacterized protein n=1 Tax=Echinococcus granulosus TaxID=6210 RepID=W6UJG8_ECHGR|nr:hypothetical protein EGR_03863 [Echinococcus granulosus]EUB61188.1 hypothetical protein EGR_03863 [Echinococcus granulosus]